MSDDDLHQISKEADEVVRIERLTHHMQRIREGVGEMKEAMKEMAAAINRLAVIEERQNQDRQALERAFSAISDVAKKHDQSVERVTAVVERMEARLRALELAAPVNHHTTDMVQKVVWLVLAAVVGAILVKIVGL